MNKAILMGRLTRDPEVRYTANGDQDLAIARFTLAVDRRYKREGDQQTADFIPCVAFGKPAEFASKYYHQGLKVVVSGRLQTGSYTDRDGKKVYTTDLIVEEQEFAESKAASEQHQRDSNQRSGSSPKPDRSAADSYSDSMAGTDGFMNIPDGIEEELPFS